MSHRRVNEIDLLRFLAALSVVIFHYGFRGHTANVLSGMPNPNLASAAKYGYLGVQLFFMISGFVVLMTAAASNRLRDFCISRIVRLYPAFWLCCTITYAATVAFDGAPAVTFEQYLFNLTMLTGFTRIPPVDGAYWSLNVEIRFYILVAAVLTFGRIKQAQRFIVLWLIACMALEAIEVFSFGSAPALLLHYLDFFLIKDFAAYFAAGAIFYLIWSEGVSRAKCALLVACWGLAIFQSGHSVELFEKANSTVLNHQLVFMIITTFFVVMMLISLRRTGQLGSYRWPALGAVSYPLYLLHQNLGYIVLNHLHAKINASALLLGTIIFFIIASYVVHVLVERKFASRLKSVLSGTFASRAASQ